MPEDFGISPVEYQQATEYLARFDGSMSMTVFGFFIVVCIVAGAAIGYEIKRAIELNRIHGDNITVVVAGAISSIIMFYILSFIWVEINKRMRLKKLSDPIYRKIQLYEDTLIQYKKVLIERQRQAEDYWKSLKGIEFEDALKKLYTDLGYSVIRTKASCDEGIDLILRKDKEKIIVQCKGHEKPIGVGAVRDLYGVMMHSGAERAVLACPVGFTDGVRKFADGKPIELLTAKELVGMAESVHNDKKK